jgi:hypothetical protein
MRKILVSCSVPHLSSRRSCTVPFAPKIRPLSLSAYHAVILCTALTESSSGVATRQAETHCVRRLTRRVHRVFHLRSFRTFFLESASVRRSAESALMRYTRITDWIRWYEHELGSWGRGIPISVLSRERERSQRAARSATSTRRSFGEKKKYPVR